MAIGIEHIVARVWVVVVAVRSDHPWSIGTIVVAIVNSIAIVVHIRTNAIAIGRDHIIECAWVVVVAALSREGVRNVGTRIVVVAGAVPIAVQVGA